MELFAWRACYLIGLLPVCLVLAPSSVYCLKTIEVLPKALEGLNEKDIVRVLPGNVSSESVSLENLTLAELVTGARENRTESAGIFRTANEDDGWWVKGRSELRRSNPYYDAFADEIDNEAKKWFQLVATFDPSAGAVSESCRKQSEIYRRELQKFSLWALKMLDATAKIPSGLLNGNVNQFGDFDECLGIDEEFNGIKGQYCLASLQLEVDDSRPDLKRIHRLVQSHYAFRSNMSDPGHRLPRFSTLNWAICSPAACTSKDIETSLERTIARHTAGTGLNVKVRVDGDMCQVKRTEGLPTATLVAGSFFAGVIVLTIVTGICDHCGANIGEILLSFSLKRNVKKLVSLKRSEDDIATLHGIRALNAFMLIVAHKSMAIFFNPYINRTEMTEYVGKPWTVIGRAASLYTDLFIMLSGLLTTYAFAGRLRRTGSLDVKKEYLSRLMRLVPTLGALVLFCTHVMPFLGSGPQWNLVVTHHAEICKRTWWRNFLFIHNYYGFENMCLTHTHHLGIDTQLFALSPLMVTLLYRRPKWGYRLLALAALFSTVLRYHVTIQKNLNNYVFFGASIRQLFDTANFSYILPSHRLTVYIMGVLLGYWLKTRAPEFKIGKVALNIGWIVCSLMAFGSFFGPAAMGSIHYVHNPIHAALYSAFAPIGWCAIFAWLAFVSHTGNDEGWLCKIFAWRGFLITTRLSYAIYLTQFPVFFYNVGQTRNSGHYEFFRLMLNANELGWVVGSSAVLTLLFDTPFQNLKNHLFKKPPNATQMKTRTKDD